MALFKDLAKVSNDRVRNFRNDMYLASEALGIMQKSASLSSPPPRTTKPTLIVPLASSLCGSKSRWLSALAPWSNRTDTLLRILPLPSPAWPSDRHLEELPQQTHLRFRRNHKRCE
jgi:hypothetical protein